MIEEELAQEVIGNGACISGRTVKETFTITYSRNGDRYEARALGFCVAIGKSQAQSRENLMSIFDAEISQTIQILQNMMRTQHQQFSNVIQAYQRYFDLDGNN